MLGKRDGLGADSTGDIQYFLGCGPLGLDEGRQLLALPTDARIPVPVDQVVQGCKFVVKSSHREDQLLRAVGAVAIRSLTGGGPKRDNLPDEPMIAPRSRWGAEGATSG